MKSTAVVTNHLWSKRFGSTSNDSCNSVATDSAGNVVIAGEFTGTIQLPDSSRNKEC